MAGFKKLTQVCVRMLGITSQWVPNFCGRVFPQTPYKGVLLCNIPLLLGSSHTSVKIKSDSETSIHKTVIPKI